MVRVMREREIDAPAELVYQILADYRQHHPNILPSAFSDFVVEEGGVGEGTVIRFAVTTGGRTQRFHQRIDEPEPGRVMREVDIDGDMVTAFTVTPLGERSHVRMETTWTSSGLRGLIERFLAPMLLKPVYDQELGKLQEYAQRQVA
jgi:hypothetical protein